jgi:hypothetical protein
MRSEAAEAWEPVQSMGLGNFVKPAQKASPGKRRRGGDGTVTGRALGSPDDALLQATPLNGTGTGRKRKSKSVTLSVPSRRSPRLQLEQSPSAGAENPRPESEGQPNLETGQPPPPSQLAASQRPYRIQLSRAKRKLHGEAREKGALHFLQMLTAYLQFLGKQYAATGQDPLIFF